MASLQQVRMAGEGGRGVVGPYDFRDAENADLIANFQFNAKGHGICHSLYELIKSRSLHLNQIVICTIICKY